MTQNKKDLKHVTEKKLNAYDRRGLKIKHGKTEHMSTGVEGQIFINGNKIRNLQALKYLGLILEKKKRITKNGNRKESLTQTRREKQELKTEEKVEGLIVEGHHGKQNKERRYLGWLVGCRF